MELSRYFFHVKTVGRKPKEGAGETQELIVELRKKYLSVPDIKALLDTLGHEVSEAYVYKVIHRHGFARLPRRRRESKSEVLSSAQLVEPESVQLDFSPESFTAQNSLGLLCLIPYIECYGIDKLLGRRPIPGDESDQHTELADEFYGVKALQRKALQS